MVGVAASFDHPSASPNEPLDVYLHGYVSSRLMNLSRTSASANTATAGSSGPQTADPLTAAPANPATTNDPTPPNGLPVTISATKVDGLVLTLTPFTHDINYRSATLFGYASLVTSTEEKLWAMEAITNSVVSDHWRHTRVPPDGAEMQSTSILKVKVVGGSGKVRVGGPRDEKKDLVRDDVRRSVWTGVIPVWEHFGEPAVCEGVAEGDERENLVKDVPRHVVDFARERREENERYAIQAVVDRSQD